MKDPTRIFLTGMMGAGKTTQGKALAQQLGWEFLDLDEWIVEQEGQSIPQIFAQQGETHFRQLETQYLRQMDHFDLIVIATGGGTPCHDDNMSWIKTHGLSIWLDPPIETLLQRLHSNASQRPLLAGKNADEQRALLTQLHRERSPCYAKADLEINEEEAEKVLDTIVKWLQLQLK